MIIKSLELADFRNYENLKIDFKPTTILEDALINGSGKSQRRTDHDGCHGSRKTNPHQHVLIHAVPPLRQVHHLPKEDPNTFPRRNGILSYAKAR